MKHVSSLSGCIKDTKKNIVIYFKKIIRTKKSWRDFVKVQAGGPTGFLMSASH